jgi:FMN-dependent NADH-azoreductase
MPVNWRNCLLKWLWQMNFQTPYLATVFGFIGITDITFVEVENDELGEDALAKAIATARTQIAQLVASHKIFSQHTLQNL